MKHFKILLATGLVLSPIYGEEIPLELERLKDQHARKIAEVDKVYLGELEKLLSKYTRAGDLENANKVAEIINNLRGNPTSTIPTTDEELREYLEGSDWEFEKGKVITFHRDGKIRKSWGIQKPEWEVKGMRVIIEAEDKIINFLNDFTEASKVDKRRVREHGRLIRGAN